MTDFYDDAPPMSDAQRYYAYEKDYGYPHPESLCCCCDELGMCFYCEQAEEEAEADERNEAFARDPDEDDFPPDEGILAKTVQSNGEPACKS